MGPSAIEVRDLEQRYSGRTVLRVPHLAVAPGETLTLLGPNGSGKSTLMRAMGLLEAPWKGTVMFNGNIPITPRERLEQRRRMTMVFQDPLLFGGTVQRNVAYGLRVRGLDARAVKERVGGALHLLGIEGLRHRLANTLSGGEAQKVALARCIAIEPEVLFLDEPTAYLDAPAKEAFVRDLRHLLSNLGVTTVFVTHDRSEALGLHGKVAILEGGHLIQVGEAERVFRSPATLSVAEFLGAQLVGKGEVVTENLKRVLRVNGLLITLETGEDYTGAVDLVIRPEDVRLEVEGQPRDGLISVKGRVKDITPQGQLYRVTLSGPLNVCGYLTAHDMRAWSLRVGDELRANFYPDSLHLVPGARGMR